MNVPTVAAISTLVLAPVSFGAISVVSELREVAAFATGTNASGTTTDGPEVVMPASPGIQWSTANVATAGLAIQGVGAGGSAIQVSGWTLGEQLSLEAQGSASTSITVTPASGGISAQVTARSIFDVVFSIPAGTSVSFQGSASGVGTMRLENAITQTVLHSGSGFYNAMLGPMNLRVYASAIAEIAAPPSAGSGGGFAFVLSVVPAPGTGLWLAVAALSMRRRR